MNLKGVDRLFRLLGEDPQLDCNCWHHDFKTDHALEFDLDQPCQTAHITQNVWAIYGWTKDPPPPTQHMVWIRRFFGHWK